MEWKGVWVMSTSCIIALKQGEDVVLLEKKHDGFEESVRVLLNNAVAAEGLDCEYIANWLIKNTDIQFSLFIHKYPWLLVVFDIDTSEIRSIKINPIGLKRISDVAEIYANEIIGF